MRFLYFFVSLFVASTVATVQSQPGERPVTPRPVVSSVQSPKAPMDYVTNFFTSFSAGTTKVLSDMPNHLKAMSSKTQILKDSTQTSLEDLKDKLVAIKYEELPKQAKDYIRTYVKEHPYQTAFHIVNGVIYFTPATLTYPVLSLLGFTSHGPRAASVASGIMSVFGTGAARGVLATVQSAAMGGMAWER
ncbi:hypothetical protein H2199_008440 [Coniosporium tulheliwenetii]|uniref:Uncharacterized protein n=1 Tax=Coniosporium tulheliwenetii TaxID=3383036 RepID=A0ACC2YJR8_9PEZI|nr:hypothetical protein H2199_008440 [Cladosporium sp. JES 115]